MATDNVTETGLARQRDNLISSTSLITRCDKLDLRDDGQICVWNAFCRNELQLCLTRFACQFPSAVISLSPRQIPNIYIVSVCVCVGGGPLCTRLIGDKGQTTEAQKKAKQNECASYIGRRERESKIAGKIDDEISECRLREQRHE